MTDEFEPNKFRKKRGEERAEREASASGRLVAPAILLSILLAFCIGIYRHLT